MCIRALFVLSCGLVAFIQGSPLEAQLCQQQGDSERRRACLEQQVDDLRIEIERTFAEYVELLPSEQARSAEIGQDQWERYLEDECREAGDRFRGGPLILLEILSCQEWGARRRAFQLRLLLAAMRGGEFLYDPNCFVPDSDLVALTGWVADRGTDPAAPAVVINLEFPLCTDLGDGPQMVRAVQLVGVSPGVGRRARRLYGLPVQVEGRLFLPHLAHHRTPLVMVVHRVDPR